MNKFFLRKTGSKLEACKELKMSTKTISKYLDSDKEYKGLYFYSVEALL